MKMIRIGLLAAVCMIVCGVCEAEVAQKADGGIWGDPEISAAVEKIRAGQTVDTMRLTSKVDPKSSWKPLMKNLPAYHACLGTNENPRVQFFAIAAISRFKEKSSVEPLQKFIVASQHRLQECTISHEEDEKEPAKAAQRRLKGGLLSREESAMLQRAIGGAMETLGEIDGDTDLSVAFLGTLLKHDMAKEWGGAVVHSALAKKGLPGLRRLLEESLIADNRQMNYVCSAISEIRDPALVDALYAACLNVKYPVRVRIAALSDIARMRAATPQAEQLVIDILMNENSDLRRAAVCRVGEFGTEKGFKLLRDLRNAPGKGGPELVQVIDDTLLRNNIGNALDGVVKAILSPTTPDDEKLRLCSNIRGIDKGQVSKHAETLATCLKVENNVGEPLNAARIHIWLILYTSTGVEHPLTLDFDNDPRIKSEITELRFAIETYLNRNAPYKGKQPEEMAKDIIKQNVRNWVNGKTEKTGGVK
ncbi:MAG: HEAT repeat domain-containing protein [bacterium]